MALARCSALLTRRNAGVQRGGGLGGGPAEDVPGDERRSLARRQDLESGQERELDRLAGDRDRLRLLLARGDLVEEPVWVGRQPRDLADVPQGGQPARAAPEGIETDVGRDAVQPGANERAAVERVARPPRPEERLLDRILGFVEGRQHPVAVDVELAPVSLGEGRECGLLTGERDRDPLGHAAASSTFTTASRQSRLTSWTSQVLPSGSSNGMNVA